MKDIVYFDLETKKSLNAVGGGKHKDKLGMSIGVTYSTKTGQYHIYDESNVNALVDQLIQADLVVGYNHMQFDYPVLQAYTIYDLASQTLNLDMMLDLEEKLGFRLKLDSVASASLGLGKTANGLDALKWWAAYKKSGDETYLIKIAKYCCYDVKVTKCVHEFGIEHSLIRYDDKAGGIADIDVSWG